MQIPLSLNRLLGLFLLFLIGCSSPQSVYYVDSQSGNDSNQGTLNKPFKTIEKVNSLPFHADNSVFFAGGQTFNVALQFNGLTGTKEQPITISSYGKGRAIVNGGNGNAIYADRCSWLQIKNLVVTGIGRLQGSTGSGIEFRNSQNCSSIVWNPVDSYGRE